MILYLLLAIFCGLMTLIALALTIGGLVKRRRKLWVGALVGLVIFVLATVFTAYTYIRESVNYMASDEFQQETRKKARNVGQTWGNTVSGAAEGVEATLDDEAIAKLLKKQAVIAGKGMKAMEAGLDETVGKVTLYPDSSLAGAAITIGRAEVDKGKDNAVSLFLNFKQAFDGKLSLTVYDSKGLARDKSTLNIKEQAGTGKVFTFTLPYLKPDITGYCVLAKE